MQGLYLPDVRAGIDFIDRVGERWIVTAGRETIETVLLPRIEPLSDEPSGSIARFIRAKGTQDVIGTLVYPDRRGDGFGISRYEDDPRLDFFRVDGEPDVHFAHKSGFMCQTSAVDPQRLRELIAAASTSPTAPSRLASTRVTGFESATAMSSLTS